MWWNSSIDESPSVFDDFEIHLSGAAVSRPHSLVHFHARDRDVIALLPLLLLYAAVVGGLVWKKPAWALGFVAITMPLICITVIGLWPVLFPPADGVADNGPPRGNPEQQSPSTNDPRPDQTTVSQASLQPFRPIQNQGDGYVQAEACRECHPGNFESWHDSYHRTMTQVATPDIVMGNFEGQTIDVGGGPYRVYEQDEICWGEIPNRILSGNAPGASGSSPVPLVMTTGSHHMQVYWFPLASGRMLGQFPLVYVKEIERWVPRHSCFLQPPGEPPGIEAGRWNNTCLQCHTTHPKQRLSRDFVFDTNVAEFGISCEACHGPGEDHIALHRSARTTRSSSISDPIVNPASLSHKASSQVCGNCHSINTHQQAATRNDGHAFRPGKQLEANRHLYRLNDASVAELQRRGQDPESFFDASFWKDGMVRVSGREFNGLVESPCFQRGEMSCLSCHALHQEPDDPRDATDWADDQLAVSMDSDKACLQCHSQEQYGMAHTKHSATSSGSRCYNCHMPHTTYGLLKGIRSHTVSSPSVLRDDIQAGRPNACNLCHLDRTLQWSSNWLNEWWKLEKPELDETQKTVSAGALWTLTGDASIRALVAWHMGWDAAKEIAGTDWSSRYLIELLNDPYDAVRYIAVRSLQSFEQLDVSAYDHLAPEADRRTALQTMIEQWNNRSSEVERRNEPALLIREGKIASDRWNTLLKRRDNRPIFLDE